MPICPSWYATFRIDPHRRDVLECLEVGKAIEVDGGGRVAGELSEEEVADRVGRDGFAERFESAEWR